MSGLDLPVDHGLPAPPVAATEATAHDVGAGCLRRFE